MKVKDYEYSKVEDDYEISDKRKDELIKKLKNEIGKKNTIALYKVLEIGKNDDEYDFIFYWLDENYVDVRGTDGTITGEINNYEQIRKYGQSAREDYISKDSQIDYFVRIEKGKMPNATKQEKIDGKKARSEFIKKNLKLADWVANNPQFNKFNYSFEQLQSFAYEGLVRAVDNFRYQETHLDENCELVNNAFSSYAVPTMIRTIYREIYRESPLPIYLMYEIGQLDNFIRDYELENEGQAPSNEDIVNILGIKELKVEKIKKAKEYYEQNGKLLNTVDEYFDYIHSDDAIIDSLDDSDYTDIIGSGKRIFDNGELKSKTPYNDNGYAVDGVYVDLDDSCYEKSEKYVEERTTYLELRNAIDKVLDTLTNREKFIIMGSFRFLTGEEMSYNQLGSALYISASRVGQIYAKAIRKLRHPGRKENLKEYIYMELSSIKGYKPLIDPETPDEELYHEFMKLYKENDCLIAKRLEEKMSELSLREKFIIKAKMGNMAKRSIPLNESIEVFGRCAVTTAMRKVSNFTTYINSEGKKLDYKCKKMGYYERELNIKELYFEYLKSEMLKQQEENRRKLPLHIIEDMARLQVLKDTRGSTKKEILELSKKINKEFDELIKIRDANEGEEPDPDER